MAISYHRLWTVSSGRSSVIFVVVFVNCKVRDTAKRLLGKKLFIFENYLQKNDQKRLPLTLKMAFAPLYYAGEFPTSIKKKMCY